MIRHGTILLLAGCYLFTATGLALEVHHHLHHHDESTEGHERDCPACVQLIQGSNALPAMPVILPVQAEMHQSFLLHHRQFQPLGGFGIPEVPRAPPTS